MKKIIVLIYLIMSILIYGQTQPDFVASLLGTSTGELIKLKNGEKVHPLASVTKLMTILLTYEAIESGKIGINDMVKIRKDVRHIGGSRIWMSKKDRISVLDLIKATAVYSANNAAYSLAYYVSDGNLEKFIRMMNKKAKSFGMKNTHYCTPAGLPPTMTGKGMDVSTVEDIYKLTQVLVKNDEYMKIASMKKTTIRNGTLELKNRNKLLGIDGIFGMKTGHHSKAGYNIAIVSKKNGKELIEIVFGSPNEKTRDQVVLKDLESFAWKNNSKISQD